MFEHNYTSIMNQGEWSLQWRVTAVGGAIAVGGVTTVGVVTAVGGATAMGGVTANGRGHWVTEVAELRYSPDQPLPFVL